MRRYFMFRSICFVFFATVLFFSCSGQTSSQKQNIKSAPGASTAAANESRNRSYASTNMLQDRSGNIWYCTYNNGVYRYDGKSFYHYTEKDGLSSNFVWSILEDDKGVIWFCTADGVTCYDGKQFAVIPVIAITRAISYQKTKPDNYGVPKPIANSVWAMLQDGSGIFWFGTSTGVYRYDGKNYINLFDDYRVLNKSRVSFNTINAFGVEAFYEDKHGQVWFGGRGTDGVFVYDLASGVLQNFDPGGKDCWLRPLLEDEAGNMWFAARNLFMFKYDGITFSRFGEKQFNDWPFSMAEDNTGDLWFSNGQNGGVTRYDGKSFTNFTDKEGLCNNTVWSILKDKTGNLWFSSRNSALCRYDGKTFTKFLE